MTCAISHALFDREPWAMAAPRSTIYELVNLLLRQGMLGYSGGDGRVFLGRKLHFLGIAYSHHFDLLREGESLLSHLAQETRETARCASWKAISTQWR